MGIAWLCISALGALFLAHQWLNHEEAKKVERNLEALRRQIDLADNRIRGLEIKVEDIEEEL